MHVAALPAPPPPRQAPVLTALFAFALFVSAFLLFVLEPMVAKTMLPKLGGTPMVWNTCVVFFQAALLAGYLAAHLLTRPRRSSRVAWLYPALVVAAAVALPMSFPRVPSADSHPALWLLGELIRVAALPTVALAMNAPALQALFSRTLVRGAADPYFLYAASNAGSLLALLAYPTVIEPALGLQPETRVWAAVYVLLAMIVLTCAFATRRYPQRTSLEDAPAHVTIGKWQRVRWITLALIPSSLMLGVTTHISTDIAAVPLIWVVPLALYLATFVIAFGERTPRAGAAAERRVPLLATALVVFMAASATLPMQFDIPLHLAMFTAVAMMCHGRLAAERPPAQHLTEFYLLVSLGGMMGGLFNTLVAPVVFDRVTEYPLMLICACAVPALDARLRPRVRFLQDAGSALASAAFVGGLTVMLLRAGPQFLSLRVAVIGALGLAVFKQARHTLRFALMLAAMLVGATLTQPAFTTVLEAERTFFGSYRVSLEEGGAFHALFHGTTLHGREAIDGASRGEPLTYYHRAGPFGQAFTRLPRLRDAADVAVVGLGVGSLAAYAHGPQRWTFFEIDPAVERIARDQRYFHFLESCGLRCAVVLGDARLSLAAVQSRFDAIVLDAFSSDSIPLHLLTREALSMYVDHLKPGGLLIFHISNRYLRLGPPLARLVADHAMMAVEQQQSVDTAEQSKGMSASDWVVASADAETIRVLASDPQWKALTPPQQMRVWTDDYSNILAVLKFRD